MNVRHMAALALLVAGLCVAPARLIAQATAPSAQGQPARRLQPPPPTLPLGEPLRGPARSIEDDIAALRTAAPQGPTDATAILWERVIRGLREREPAVTESARRHHESGQHELAAGASRESSDRARSEFAAALLEAPSWALPYRDIARPLEALGRSEDAVACLELYLVAEPRAEDWERVREKIRALRPASSRSKPSPELERGKE